MSRSHLYWALCLPGAALPYAAFVPWAAEHGLDAPAFVAELFSTRIGSFFGWDVIVSAVVLLTFALFESPRLGQRAVWLTAAATGLVGVSLGLPLLLALRERHTETLSQRERAGPAA
jgi:Na+/melibiose symporter-like transporter